MRAQISRERERDEVCEKADETEEERCGFLFVFNSFFNNYYLLFGFYFGK